MKTILHFWYMKERQVASIIIRVYNVLLMRPVTRCHGLHKMSKILDKMASLKALKPLQAIMISVYEIYYK